MRDESSATATLTIVVPCFNEQEVLPETIKRLRITARPD